MHFTPRPGRLHSFGTGDERVLAPVTSHNTQHATGPTGSKRRARPSPPVQLPPCPRDYFQIARRVPCCTVATAAVTSDRLRFVRPSPVHRITPLAVRVYTRISTLQERVCACAPVPRTVLLRWIVFSLFFFANQCYYSSRIADTKNTISVMYMRTINIIPYRPWAVRVALRKIVTKFKIKGGEGTNFRNRQIEGYEISNIAIIILGAFVLSGKSCGHRYCFGGSCRSALVTWCSQITTTNSRILDNWYRRTSFTPYGKRSQNKFLPPPLPPGSVCTAVADHGTIGSANVPLEDTSSPRRRRCRRRETR